MRRVTLISSYIPDYGFFTGNLDEFDAVASDYFSKFSDFCKKYIDNFKIMNALIFSDRDKVKYNIDWKNDVNRLFDDKDFHDKVLLEKNFSLLESSFKEFMESVERLTLKRMFTREGYNIDKYNSIKCGCTANKAQEVMEYINSISLLFNRCYNMDKSLLDGEVNHKPIEELLAITPEFKKYDLKRDKIQFIDVGAGKGYLSIFLTAELNLRTLAIEASLAHACHLRDRFDILVCQKKASPDSFKLMDLCIGFVTNKSSVDAIVSNSISYNQWLEIVTEYEKTKKTRNHEKNKLEKKKSKLRTNSHEELKELSYEKVKYTGDESKPRVIQGELAVEITSLNSELRTDKDYFNISLHACGDLSVVTHEIQFSPLCRGTISVPCCYQHLTERCFPLCNENRDISTYIFEGDASRRKDYLNYALSQYNTTFDDHNKILRSFLQREYVTPFVPPRSVVKKIKKQEAEDTVDYVLRISNTLGNYSYNREDVNKVVDYIDENIWHLKLQIILREFCGHVLESFVLTDRLKYYAELCEKSGRKYFVGMFDIMSNLSPRGYSHFTLRID